MTDLYSEPYSKDSGKRLTKTWAELEAERAEKRERENEDEKSAAEQSKEAQEDAEYVDNGDVDEPLNDEEADSLSDYVVTRDSFREDHKE